MGKLEYYLDMEAKFRKQADTNPVDREKHLASADAWQLLSNTAGLFLATQIQTKELLASIAKLKT